MRTDGKHNSIVCDCKSILKITITSTTSSSEIELS